jgi:hypothetical protein
MASTDVIIAGPQTLTLDGVDMGHTLDGFTVTVDRQFADVLVDKYGSMPLDKVLTGNGFTVKVKLAESTYRQFDAAIPEGFEYDGVTTKDRIGIGTDAGFSLRSVAKQLRLHPTSLATSNTTKDFVIYKAVSTEAVEIPLQIDNQQVLEVTFTALVDESYETGRRLGHYGSTDVS